MVWTYEESYPGYPYLTDWKEKEFEFGIEMSESIVGTSAEDAVVAGEMREVQVIHTDGILKPSFYFAGNRTDRPYQLQLNSDGLRRRVYSTVEEGNVGAFNAVRIRTRKLGIGGFEDFKALGQYALERLPQISEEIILPPTQFPEDIPDETVEFILKYRGQCLGVLDWESTQREIAKRFCSLFGTFILAARGEPGVGLILRNGDDKFTPQQVRELSDLIAPLRKM